MRVLRLVGPGEDGESVILEGEAGEQFSLPVDDRLRAASRADRAHLGRLEVALAGPLRPRDIQIRVRAGESPAELAEQSGMPVERVMRFAYPVLAERSRVADEARRAQARRVGDGHLVPFGELVDSRFAAHGIEPGAVGWDAYRRPDGGWTVTADVPDERFPTLAKFSFSLGNRTVSALDDVAADLLSGRPIKVPPAVIDPMDGFSNIAFGRLSAVPDEAAPSGRRRAQTHPLPVDVEDDEELFDQDVFDQEGLNPASFSAYLQAPAFDESDLRATELAADQAEIEHARAAVSTQAAEEPRAETLWSDLPAVAEAEHAAPLSPSRRGGKHGDKPRMPSWDDILLGVRRRNE